MAQLVNFLASVPASPTVTTLWTAPNTGSNGPCSSFMVAVASSSTYSLAVSAPGLHANGEFIVVMPGQMVILRHLDRGIGIVYAMGWYDAATGNSTLGAATLVNFGPVAKTRAQ